jgi:cellulose synthase/poly-beta-1,6-N-acetylglucosamine synthase-like glycosyltransferase
MLACSIIMPHSSASFVPRRCLYALLAGPPERTSFEIILVDDSPTGVPPGLLTDYAPRLRVVRSAAQKGFAAAANAGATFAAGAYLVFLRNTAVPQPGWLDALARYADVHPAAAAVGSKLLAPNKTVQHAGIAFDHDRQPRLLYTGFPGDHPAVSKSRRFQAVAGTGLLVRRPVFTEVRGFDTAFLHGYEDVDFCLRLGASGHEVHYCHRSVLQSLEVGRKPNGTPAEDQDAELFLSRWAGRVKPDDLQFYLADRLLKINHEQRLMYPLDMFVSPLLAVLNEENTEAEVGQRLGVRSREVLELLEENLRLKVQVQKAQGKGQAGDCPSTGKP